MGVTPGDRPHGKPRRLEEHLEQVADLVQALLERRHGGERPPVPYELVAARTADHDSGKDLSVRPDRAEPSSSSPSTRAPRSLGRARKVSVSMPEELTEAVRQRVAPGDFSQYVTEAVARQLELDLLHELTEALEAEHGPVPDELLAEAGAAWPDAE